MKMQRMFLGLLSAAFLLFLAACAVPLETPNEGGGKTGRVVISIAGGLSPAEAAENVALINRSLLPELGTLDYKLEFTRDGETVPTVSATITATTLTQDLEEGNYTLTVTAYKAGTSVPVAEGGVLLEVSAGQSVSVTVPLALCQAGTGYLDYVVALPAGMTLISGSLTLYPLSDGVEPVNIDLSGGLSGVEEVPSKYYRTQFSVYGSTGVEVKFIAKTTVLHIVDSFTTPAHYSLTAGDFADTTLYIAGNEAELDAALTAIKTVGEEDFTILVNANFASQPVSLADAGYNGKTITLRSTGGAHEISLASQGSLFTVGAAASEPAFILQDIILKGIADNSVPLVKIDNGALIMEDGAIITDNTGLEGGGVYIVEGTFTMQDSASVTGNTATEGVGGGVFSAGTFTMQDSASVTGNTVTEGLGGGVFSWGTFTMQDNASVSGNTASSDYSSCLGGGVYFEGSFTMQGNASVSGNTASASYSSYGGGVYFEYGNFTMQDNASVSGNTAAFGGGVYIGYGGTLIKTGGVIYGFDGGSVKNTAYVAGSAISFNKTRNRNAAVGPGLNFNSDFASGLWDDDFSGTELYIARNRTELLAALNDIKAATGTAFTILVTGGFSSSSIGLTDAGYSEKTITLRSCVSGVHEISLSSNGSLFTVGGSSVTGLILIFKDISLKGINSFPNPSNNASLIVVNGNTLVIKPGTLIRGNRIDPNTVLTSASGGGVDVSGGVLEMSGGAISDNYINAIGVPTSYYEADAYGGGVALRNGSTFSMSGGSISGNTARAASANFGSGHAYAVAWGGGIYADNTSYVFISDGVITGNATVAYSESTSTQVYAASSASSGGGLYVKNDNFEQTGGSVSGNTVTATATCSKTPAVSRGADNITLY
jgi:hypothetical protein